MLRRNVLPRLALSIALVALSAALASGHATATEAMERGPPAEAEAVLPVLTARWHDFPVDLTGDGVPEHLLMGGDGVVHAYSANGTLLWISDTERIVADEGLPINTAGLLFGPFRYLAEPAGAGPAFVDLDGDGIDDLVAGMFLALDDPVWRLQSAIVAISGADGSPLDFRLYGGVVRNLVIDDFTGDGLPDLFFTEEDGSQHTNQAETHTLGTGASFQMHLTTLNGTPIWSKALPHGWAQATAIGTGVFDGDGPDVALAVTGGFDKYVAFLDQRTTPFPQTLYAIDGQTGNVVWQEPLRAEYARSMHVVDADGDQIDDVVLRIQEPAAMHTAFTRGDERARLSAYRGFDGALLWDQVGAFGPTPTLHDSYVRDGAGLSLVVAYSAEGEAPYSSEDAERLALFALQNGTRLADLDLTKGIDTGDLVEGAFDLGTFPAPSQVSDMPDIRLMHIAAPDPAGGELVIGSDRGLIGVRLSETAVEVAWRSEGVHVDREVFYALGANELWTQDVAGGKMIVYRTTDGALLREMSLLTLISAETRVDVDADGDLDRVGATSGHKVIAFQDDTTVHVWQRDVEDGVIDLVHEDVDGDGQEDVVVIGRLSIFALDGSTGSVLWRHDHGPRGQVSAWRFADMDRDGTSDLVFGIRTSNQGSGSSPAGAAFITSLDGETGEVGWTRVFAPPAYEIGGIDLGDVDGDGQLDVAFVTQTVPEALWYHVGVLDGGLGLPLWEVQTAVRSGENTLDQDGVVFADADADGDLDVWVAQMGIQTVLTTYEPTVRAHDGRTGVGLWTEPIDQGHVMHLEGLYTGAFGPNGTHAVAAMTNLVETGWGLTVLTPQGQELYTLHLTPVAFFTDLQIGDVTGDRFDDLVIASPHGLTVVDGNASVSAGNATFVGHLSNWATSKVHLVDLDDDVALEVDFFSSEGNWPLHLGGLPYTDLARGKALGTADLNLGPKKDTGGGDGDDGGGDPDEPVNVAPSASFIVDRTSGYPGDAFTFTSTSSDPDGNITSTVWSFGDGTTATGTTVVKTYRSPGSHEVRLSVTDDRNATDGTSGTVTVFPEDAFALSQSRSGSHASPGEVVTYTLSVFNTGRNTDTYTASLTGPDAWSMTILGSPTVTVDSGMRHDWTVQVWVDAPILRGVIEASVVAEQGGTHSKTHPVVVPLVLDAALDEGGGPYGPLEEVSGGLRLTWRDGSPVADVSVDVLQVGTDAASTVTTDAEGHASFVVPHDEAHRMPGSYTVKLDPDVAGYGTYRTLPFQVTVAG